MHHQAAYKSQDVDNALKLLPFNEAFMKFNMKLLL